ncbi:e9imm peptide [Micromonospora sp. MS34]|uniref:e9imm peptide n=1 Tax=Micromonospora sp. MS34 TaxID=3385971 RepID=UPI00399F540C
MSDLAAKLTRDEAIALVERIMSVDYADDDELGGWLDQLERDLVCPDGYVSGLIFWTDPELTAAEVVDRALAYQPIQMRSTPWTAPPPST